MIQRCTNPDASAYERYGGRGIKVYRRWRNSYVAFLRDMGRKPSRAHSIERTDNDGNYEPGNCKWSLRKEQTRNRSSNNYLIAFGKRRCVTDWAKDLGAPPSSITTRISRGWSVEDAVSVPPEKHEQMQITHNGETLTAAEWSRRSGVKIANIKHRLRSGVDAENAIFHSASLGSGRKPSRFVTIDGTTMSLVDWSRDRGIGRATLVERLKAGWSERDAIMLPLGSKKPGTEAKLEHGTINGYVYHKCRCELCKQAKKEYRNKHS